MAELGTIALMGSGEFTASMVEVHKNLIARLGPTATAVFLDTPAGFQPNADQISAGAVDYFRSRVLHPMSVASFKSRDQVSQVEQVQLLRQLRDCDYILMGPGSPSYTIRQLRPTPIPALLVDHVLAGGCLVAASAAALTMGRFTLPVYEIYKVGQPLHWLDGLNILAHFGLNLAVVPHWNNSDGGSHDTNRCFVGRDRFASLLQLLDASVAILGLDEHTACILDLAGDSFAVRGKGEVVLLRGSGERCFQPGGSYPLDIFRAAGQLPAARIEPQPGSPVGVTAGLPANSENSDSFQEKVQSLGDHCRRAWERQDTLTAVNLLLQLEQVLWETRSDADHCQAVKQGRQLLRDLLVTIGLAAGPPEKERHLAPGPVIEALVAARQRFRKERNWAAADGLREALASTGIVIEDTETGCRWTIVKGYKN